MAGWAEGRRDFWLAPVAAEPGNFGGSYSFAGPGDGGLCFCLSVNRRIAVEAATCCCARAAVCGVARGAYFRGQTDALRWLGISGFCVDAVSCQGTGRVCRGVLHRPDGSDIRLRRGDGERAGAVCLRVDVGELWAASGNGAAVYPAGRQGSRRASGSGFVVRLLVAPVWTGSKGDRANASDRRSVTGDCGRRSEGLYGDRTGDGDGDLSADDDASIGDARRFNVAPNSGGHPTGNRNGAPACEAGRRKYGI